MLRNNRNDKSDNNGRLINNDVIKNFGFNVKKDLVDNGFKLSDNMRNKVMKKVANLEDEDKRKDLSKLINNICGKDKFYNADCLKDNEGFDNKNKYHLKKVDFILKRESAFNGTLGKALIDFFQIEPEKMIIFEDNENVGRIIKEKTIYNGNVESFLFFIPVYNSKDQYVVDEDIKRYNNIAKEYDLVNGRFVSWRPKRQRKVRQLKKKDKNENFSKNV